MFWGFTWVWSRTWSLGFLFIIIIIVIVIIKSYLSLLLSNHFLLFFMFSLYFPSFQVQTVKLWSPFKAPLGPFSNLILTSLLLKNWNKATNLLYCLFFSAPFECCSGSWRISLMCKEHINRPFPFCSPLVLFFLPVVVGMRSCHLAASVLSTLSVVGWAGYEVCV